MARNGLRHPALPRALKVGGCEVPCCHVSMSLPCASKPLPRHVRRNGAREAAGWACSSTACCTSPRKLLWKGTDCSQGCSLVYDPFCFLQQSGSHYKYTTGKVVVGFGGVLVVCFGFWLFFFGGSRTFRQFHGFCHLLSTYFFVQPCAFETLHPDLGLFAFLALKSSHYLVSKHGLTEAWSFPK